MTPVLYSSWPNDLGPGNDTATNSCLALNLDKANAWTALDCDQKVNYFLCESNSLTTYTTSGKISFNTTLPYDEIYVNVDIHVYMHYCIFVIV